MIVETSALVAIVFNEPDADSLIDRLRTYAVRRMSIASYVEVAMVVERRGDPAFMTLANNFIVATRIVLEPVTIEQGQRAIEAFHRFGKGRHPAKLNFGDCLSYGLAKSMDEPLLFKGNDFTQADIVAA